MTTITVDELFAGCELVWYINEPAVFCSYQIFTKPQWFKTWQAEYEMRGIDKPTLDFTYKWRQWEIQNLEELL